MRSSFLLPCVLAGCVPPDAPTELDALASYLFVHAADDDPAAIQAGLVNLDAWLDTRMEETSEGYAVSNPSADAIAALGAEPGDEARLVGAAVGVDLAQTPLDVAPLLSVVSPADVFPTSYTCYDRVQDADAACFADGTCDRTGQTNHSQGRYALGIRIEQRNQAELRWVTLPSGDRAIVHRTWLTAPAGVTPHLFDVPDQLYLDIVLPHGDGHRRLQATWIEARLLGDAAVPEGIALQLVLGSMKAGATAVVDWYAGDVPAADPLPTCADLLGP